MYARIFWLCKVNREYPECIALVARIVLACLSVDLDIEDVGTR